MLYFRLELFNLTLIILLYQILCASCSNLQEYCLRTNSDSFEAACLKKEVIIMNTAIYGRMKIGKCLEHEREYLEKIGSDSNILGCSTDILQFMDRRCSGKNRCEITVADDELLQLNPCHSMFKSYLEASYDCAFVVEEDRSCTVQVTPERQHIMAGNSLNATSCGSMKKPWKLEAPEGQQISVSLLTFGYLGRSTDCQPLGYLLEEQTSKNISICSNSGSRMTNIALSKSNRGRLILDRKNEYGATSFLIQIIAIGCSNVLPPADAWLRRDGNTAVVGCYTSRQSWTLRCVDNHWIGVIGNCTRDPKVEGIIDVPVAASTRRSSSLEVVVIVTIATIGITVCAAVICVGFVCWKRYSTQYKKYATFQKESPGVGTSNEKFQKHRSLMASA